jgi:hypothetical protein
MASSARPDHGLGGFGYFPQPVRIRADAPAGSACDHRGVLSESSIVDLAERRSADLDVVLLWGRRSGRLWVSVTHRPSGRMARIDATAANALDAFRHPFAYDGSAA